jgi:hypothetical protein
MEIFPWRGRSPWWPWSSEVGYTSATTGRGDHEVHKGHVVALRGGGGIYDFKEVVTVKVRLTYFVSRIYVSISGTHNRLHCGVNFCTTQIIDKSVRGPHNADWGPRVEDPLNRVSNYFSSNTCWCLRNYYIFMYRQRNGGQNHTTEKDLGTEWLL